MTDIIHTAANDATGTIATIAGDVGKVTASTEQHAEQLAAHADKLTNIDEDIRWTKERLQSLESATMDAPMAAIAELRQEMGALRDDLMGQMAALSEAIASPQPDPEPSTDPPPPAPNLAEQKEPTGLRKLLHRLL